MTEVSELTPRLQKEYQQLLQNDYSVQVNNHDWLVRFEVEFESFRAAMPTLQS